MAAKVITEKTLNAPFLFSFFFAVYGGSWREWCTVSLRLPKWEAQHHLRIYWTTFLSRAVSKGGEKTIVQHLGMPCRKSLTPF